MQKKVMRITPTVLVAATMGGIIWVSAGDLNPPAGPVTPTMKTLVEVEPRSAVNDVNAPGDSGAVFTIASAGSYYLTGNVVGESGKAGIRIAASRVTLDLNGYSLVGVPDSLAGISVDGGVANIVVCNGVIESWGEEGIFAQFAGGNGLYENLRLIDNGFEGAVVWRSHVARCAFGQQGGAGLVAAESSVAHCIAYENGTGIIAFSGSRVEGCTARFNGYGFEASGHSVIADCVATGNGLAGIRVLGDARITGNSVSDGFADGILIDPFSAEEGKRCVIDGNSLVNNDGTGLLASNAEAAGNLIIRNFATRNAVNFDIGTGNSFGPIISAGGAGDLSAVAGAGHPWANFEY